MVLNSCSIEREGDPASPHRVAPTARHGARSVRSRGILCSSLLAAVSTLALTAVAARAEESRSRPAEGAAVKALMAKLDAMEQRINTLQGELKDAKAKKAAGVGQSASLASRRPSDPVGLAGKDAQSGAAKASGTAQAGSQPGVNAMALAGPNDVKSASTADSEPQSSSPVSRLAAAFADSDPKPKFLPAADLNKAAPPPGRDLFGVAPTPVPGMRIGMYGEIKLGSMQNPAANGQWQNGFDMARLVLLPTYQVNDNITFNAELEWEHGGTAFDNDDKLHGAVEVEQAFFDIKFNDHFTLRSPGIDLIPISFTNLYHEPTLFYSVQRPELANGLIPTTWYAPSAGFYGKIVDGLNYQFQASQSAEDFGDDFAHRGDNGHITPGGYEAGISGSEALALARAPIGDFRQMSNELAYTFRLSYTPSFLPGFAGSSAIYYSPNVTPRGAYATQADGTETPLGKNAMTIFNTEARYRVPNTGLEFRGEYAYVHFSNPENLRANNDLDDTNNVGKSMWGYSAEVAYHFRAPNDYDIVPFYRYTRQNFQTSGMLGADILNGLNNPTGSGDMTFHDVGLAVFPNPSLVYKLNYTKVIDHSATGAMSDRVLAGVGWLW
ncbi:porin [Bradyrhizobium sp. SRS-191]|uniref:porin n=1 Tax=Bradyrhizobium sp. SRS-191 TaxID=2962606 RepID=UPI00211DECF4|nr:porin [Bradyrhizobium sp. SRS-191]